MHTTAHMRCVPCLDDCAILKRYRDTDTREIYGAFKSAMKEEKYVIEPPVALTLKEISCLKG